MKKQFVEYLGNQIPVPKIKVKLDKKPAPLQEDVHEDILLAEQTPEIQSIPDSSNTSTVMTVQAPVPQEPPKVVQTNKDISDSVLESLVIMLNQILQELSSIHQKLDTQKTTSEEAIRQPAPKRKIMLIRDENNKVIGANVVDEVE